MAEDQEKYQIFCDMDGVLVDLLGGINEAIYAKAPKDASERYIKAQQEARQSLGGEKLKEEDADKYSEHFKKSVRNFMYRVMGDDRHFWMNLKWQPGGEELWKYIRRYNPIILSRPTDLQSVIGKKKWVKDHLGLSGSQVQIRYNKTPYAQYKGKVGILIDDFESNTTKFEEAGGITILYQNVNDAIEELQKLGF
tara:strand:+ start:2951 stop:3535 length:585 start_codon:yes stop_codon:yes gene_type:complete